MENLKQLIVFSFVLIINAFSLSAQGGYQITGLIDSTYNYGCDSIIEIAVVPGFMNATANSDATLIIQGTNFETGPVSISVNWGDGNSTTHSGQFVAEGTAIAWSPALTHTYANPNIAVGISATVTNTVNGSSATEQFDISPACAVQMYGFVTANCDISALINAGVPFTMTGNGVTLGGVLNNGMATVTGVTPGMYDLNIDPTWLTQNGLTQLSIGPSSVYMQAGSILTFQAALSCDSVQTSDPTCVGGFVYCDVNQNGIFDALDTGIPNAVVNITSGNQYYVVGTDNNGHYEYTFNSPQLNPVIIQVDVQWISQTGNTVSNPVFTAIDSLCSLGGTTVNFAVICDSTTTQQDSMCLDGYVYCDGNNNGIYDGQDVSLANVPLLITSGNQTYQVTTNANGYYNLQHLGQQGGISVIQVNTQWMNQNGYTVVNPIYTTMDSLCSLGGGTVNFPVICDSTQWEQECVGGWVFCDDNNNGVLDTNESGFANVPIILSGQNGTTVTVYTNSQGQFFYTGSQLNSNYAIVSMDNNWLVQHGYSPNGMVYTTVTDCDSTWPIYFAMDCDSVVAPCADLWTLVEPWIGYYQNQTNYIKLKWGNYGPGAAQSYTVTLNYPAGVTPIVSSFMYSNYVISGNSVSWTFTSSSSYIYEQDIIYFNVPAGFPSGTQHNYYATITANGNNQDCNLNNNTDTLMMILGNSYDPNDKTVNNPEMINPDVADELIYRIRFQNTGTAPAQDIYIMDTLSSLLDWSTFELMDATHPVQVINLGNGVLKFNFPDIWLPDSTTNLAASQGSVSYRIRENAGNGIGTAIDNTAYIYFDWNPAIVTNTTHNVNMVLGTVQLEKEELRLFPNPVADELHIRSDLEVTAVRIYDLTGKLVYSHEQTSAIETVRATGWHPGVYLVELKRGGAWVTQRVIKK